MKSERKPSFARVHYLLRPGKNIERKMLVETFRRLGQVRPLTDYEYVGLGSIYFGDFILFHRAFDFGRMTSIELKQNSERAEFNKPYMCVTVLSGRASERLPDVTWRERPAIVWLDYDSELNREILSDIGQVASSVQPGSFLVVTLDASEEALKEVPDDPTDEFDIEQFANASLIGQLNLKCGTDVPETTDLTGDGLAQVYRQLVTERIVGLVNALRNPESGEATTEYSQVVNFRHNDGREMMTVGGVFFIQAIAGGSGTDAYGFDKLGFYRSGNDTFRIDAPKLTYREISVLNQYLPSTSVAAIPVPIDDEDKMLYSEVYRYFPTFAETDVSS